MNQPASPTTRPRKKSTHGDPSWDVALLFPAQGEWTEDEYLALENSGNRLIELVNGAVKLLPMPDLFHQGILRYLFRLLDDFTNESKRGEAFFAPLPVRVGEKHMREPDLIFLKAHRIKNRHKPLEGADLVMEIVSPGQENRDRDLKDKRQAYAKAKIPEYWIVDPERQTITILTLGAKTYKVHGKYKTGDQASSKLLPGFTINVAEAFAAGLGA